MLRGDRALCQTKLISGVLVRKPVLVLGKFFFVAALVLSFSSPARAGEGNNSSLALRNCESQALNDFKKKSVEIELASITGNVNELELGSAREQLREHLRRESENCAQGSRYSASTGAL